MPLRSVKMKRFIFGFQRRVWCPKWTPPPSSWRMVTTAMAGPVARGMPRAYSVDPPLTGRSGDPGAHVDRHRYHRAWPAAPARDAVSEHAMSAAGRVDRTTAPAIVPDRRALLPWAPVSALR